MTGIPYGITAYRYYSKQPQLTHNYAAELNAPVLAIPPSERAWPRYREILQKLDTTLPPEIWSNESYMNSPEPEAVREHAEWEKIRYLFPLVREAASMPKLGFILRDQHDPADLAWIYRSDASGQSPIPKEPSENPLLLTVLLPHLDAIRTLTKWLRFDARIAAEQGDGATAAADMIACLQMADQIRESQLLVADARSWTLFSSTINVMGNIIAEHTDVLNREQLLSLADQINRYAGGGRLVPKLLSERMTFADLVQRVYNPDGEFRSEIAIRILDGEPDWWTRLGAPVVSDRYASRDEMTERFDLLLETAETAYEHPLWECRQDSFFPDSTTETPAGPRYVLVSLLGPTAKNAYFRAQSAEQLRDAGLTVIALARYHLQHHRWPDELNALVPQFLPDIPPDRFTGEPLKYRIADGTPVLYSVGADRDDDGGQPPPGKDGNERAASWVPPDDASSAPDGDWVLWPAKQMKSND
ncbi:MAG TPA: hypothetical protein VF306_13490 [Pirellulales bacterium]